MKFRKENPEESGAGTRDDMRELVEAIGLYRSAMRHVAEKQAGRPFAPVAQRASGFRLRMVLVPALGAALAAAVITPTVVHMHHPATTASRVSPAAQVPGTATTVAKMDDTQLMDQIDSDLTEGVPDALQPLTGWDDTANKATKTAGTEK
ncbi:MAG TPA: hypothetical protein VME68_16245 [Acidobacteriaceae bacterium]|nr:hypothetical protein [Acidobacteriaceae bacterium]